MIVVSNHLFQKTDIPFPKNVVVRVNLAWMSDYEKTRTIIKKIKHQVYLDFPSGRTKPPVPTFDLIEALDLARDCKNVKYFAVSNAEDAIKINEIKMLLRDGIEFVPKIETATGVVNLKSIIEQAKIKYIMLDKDDLWPDVGMNSKTFNGLVKEVRDICKRKKVKLLELQGVIFT